MKSIYLSLNKYWAVTKITFANRMTYRVDLFSEILFMTFMFSILFFLHRATASVTPTSSVEALSLVQTMWIIFLTILVAGDRGRDVLKIVNEDILSGQIAYQLNRPYSYTIFHFAQNIGTKLPTILFGGLLTSLYIYYLVGLPDISILTLLLGLLMACIGMVIGFLMRFGIGLGTFWIGNVAPIGWIYIQVMIVAGGLNIPPALFPGAIRKIILALPFPHVMYGAARVMVGCPQAEILFYVGMQLFWLVMLLLITRLLFKRGVQHVTICGG